MPLQMPVTHLALIHARRGQAEHVGTQLENLLQPARNQVGCLDYQLRRSVEQPHVWLIQGVWATAEHMEAHFQTDPMQVFSGLVQSCAIREMTFRTCTDASQVADELAEWGTLETR